MPWTAVTFGKHRGRTLPQIIFRDPDWFFWAMENGALRARALATEAARLNRLARNIRIPTGPDGGRRVALFIIHPAYGRFDHLELAPIERKGLSTSTLRRDRIDLSLPRTISGGMDKTGAARLIADVKGYLFGSSARMTRTRCETFFDDGANFVDPQG